MKQKLFTFLCLCILCIGSAWAQKITSLSQIKNGGQYYIGATVSETDYYFMADVSKAATGVAGTSTTKKSEAVVVTIAATTGGYTMKVGDGLYLSLASTKANGKVNVVVEPQDWTFTESDGLINMKTNDYCLMKNSSTSLNFGSYASAQKNVWLQEVSNEPDPILQSIAISGTPTKTTYYEGQQFDPTGLIVTATYDKGDPKPITSGITWSFSPTQTLVAGQTSIEVKASYNEKESASYTVSGLTVNAVKYEIYSLVTDASTLKVGDILVLGNAANNAVNGKRDGDFLTAENATFNDNILTASKAIEFTLGGSSDAWTLTSTEGQLGANAVKKLKYDTTADNYVGTWTISIDGDGNATIASTNDKYGRFLYNVGSPRFLNYTSATTVAMVLPQIYRKVNNVAISPVGYSTYSSTSALVVPADETVYGAKIKNENSVELIPVEAGTVIAAGEGFIVKGEANGTVTFTVSSVAGAKISDNELLGTGNETIDLSAGDAYLLAAKDGKAIFGLCGDGVLGENKACLPAPSGANSVLGFDDATGIIAVSNNIINNGAMYNLAGQKVGSDYKGIVIVNGMKFLNK